MYSLYWLPCILSPSGGDCTLYKMGNDDTTAGRLWSPAFTAGERDCQRYSGYQSNLKVDGYKFLCQRSGSRSKTWQKITGTWEDLSMYRVSRGNISPNV